jgi:hydrogenase maturation protease
MEKTLVVGVGSVLRGDDGVGIRVIEELQKENLSSDIKLLSGDISGLELIKYFPQFERVVIIDAVDIKDKPGTVKSFNSSEIKKSDFSEVVSTHGMKLLETLTLAEKLDISPKITIIGIQPKDISFKLGLTLEIEDKIPYIMKAVKKVIDRDKK